MKYIILAILAAIQSVNVAHAEGGTREGNGGYVCRKGDEAPVLCDLYFERTGFKLPYADHQEVAYSQLSNEVRKEFERMLEIISIRSMLRARIATVSEKLSIWHNQSEISIFNTKEFLGHDAFGSNEQANSKQFGYAYAFTRLSGGLKPSMQTVQVIELDLDYMQTFSARTQALMLLHEVLHLLPAINHSIISPFIQDLSTILNIDDQQRNGAKYALTESEAEKLQEFQFLLTRLGLPESAYRYSRIVKNGGGVIYFDQLRMKYENPDSVVIPEDLYVPVAGALRDVDSGEAFYLKGQTFTAGLKPIGRPKRRELLIPNGLAMRADNTETTLTVTGALFKTCTEYDAKGVCTHEIMAAPATLEIRAGGEVSIERLEISIARYQYEQAYTKRVSGGCRIEANRFSYRAARNSSPAAFAVSIIDTDCVFNILLNKHKQIKLHALFGADFGIENKKAVRQGAESTDIGATFGKTGLGVSIANKLLLGAISTKNLIDSKQSTGSTTDTFSAFLRFDLKNHTYLQAGYDVRKDRIWDGAHDELPALDQTQKEHRLYFEAGIRHDLGGGVKLRRK